VEHNDGKLTMEGRRKLTLTGATEVVRFDEELAELARIDAELDAEPVTSAEVAESNRRDRQNKRLAMDKKSYKVAETQRRYREANKDKVAEYQRRYREKKRMEARYEGNACSQPAVGN